MLRRRDGQPTYSYLNFQNMTNIDCVLNKVADSVSCYWKTLLALFRLRRKGANVSLKGE